jgi:copper chaperone NosL
VRRARASATLILAMLAIGCRPSAGPQPIAYDREACAHCRMLISEPAFAAQLQTPDGEVASFDDPGCLLAALPAYPEASSLWFHHHDEERWLDRDSVGFLRVARSPMGYGLAAVAADAPDALSIDAARAHVDAARARRDAP